MPVSLSEGGISIEGCLGHPGQALADATGLIVLVNGRLVTDKIVLRAVREGYDSMLKDREFPVGYLSVTIPPQDVDVSCSQWCRGLCSRPFGASSGRCRCRSQ
jgi:DNA mismatch repair protein MutL